MKQNNKKINGEDNLIYLQYLHYFDSEMFLTIDGDIIAFDENDEDEIKCGKIKLTIYDEKWENIFRSADSCCQDCHDIIYNCNENGIEYWGKVAIINYIKVFKNYQNLKIGTKALKEIINELEKIYNVNFILLMVAKENSEKLINFYKKFNFKSFGNENQPIMIYESEYNNLLEF